MSNPTRTGRIERAWLKDVNRRWREFNKAAKDELYKTQSFTVNFLGPVDESGQLRMSEAQIKQYMKFVRQALDDIILGVVKRDGVEIMVNDEWMRKYIERSYLQALQVSEKQLEASGIVSGGTGVLDIVKGTATPSLVSSTASAVLAPIHLDTIAFLHNRAFNSLSQVTDEMASDIRKILVSGVEEGKSLRETWQAISERTGIKKSRAELITRTETIQAYQKGVINTATQYQQIVESELMLVWRATMVRTREQHVRWHGLIDTPEKMNERLTVSPYNCRCSLSIVTDITMPPEKMARMKAERRALLKSLDNNK